MFKIFTATRRNKELEHECFLLKEQVANLEYQLKDAKEVDRFRAESERRAWKSKRFHESRAAKALEEGKELKDRLEAENNELKSQLREQSDADLMLLALQGAGLVLSKGAVDKFVADEAAATEHEARTRESVRNRMIERGVESKLDNIMRRQRDQTHRAHIAALF